MWRSLHSYILYKSLMWISFRKMLSEMDYRVKILALVVSSAMTGVWSAVSLVLFLKFIYFTLFTPHPLQTLCNEMECSRLRFVSVSSHLSWQQLSVMTWIYSGGVFVCVLFVICVFIMCACMPGCNTAADPGAVCLYYIVYVCVSVCHSPVCFCLQSNPRNRLLRGPDSSARRMQ